MKKEMKMEIEKGVFIKMIVEGDKSFFVLQNEAGFTTNLIMLRKDILLYSNEVYLKTYLQDKLSGIFMDLRACRFLDVSIHDEKVKVYVNDLIKSISEEYKTLIDNANTDIDNISKAILEFISIKLKLNKELISVNRDSSYGILNSSNDELVFGLLNEYSIAAKLNLPLKDGDKLSVDHFELRYKFIDDDDDENDYLLSEFYIDPDKGIYSILWDVLDDESDKSPTPHYALNVKDIEDIYRENVVIDYDIDVEDVINATVKVADIVKDMFSFCNN